MVGVVCLFVFILFFCFPLNSNFFMALNGVKMCPVKVHIAS